MYNTHSIYPDSNFLIIDHVSLCINGESVLIGGIITINQLANVLCRTIDIECYSDEDMKHLKAIIVLDINYERNDRIEVITPNNDCIFIGNAK